MPAPNCSNSSLTLPRNVGGCGAVEGHWGGQLLRLQLHLSCLLTVEFPEVRDCILPFIPEPGCLATQQTVSIDTAARLRDALQLSLFPQLKDMVETTHRILKSKQIEKIRTDKTQVFAGRDLSRGYLEGGQFPLHTLGSSRERQGLPHSAQQLAPLWPASTTPPPLPTGLRQQAFKLS